MFLYHGSNVEVQKPLLFATDRKADFGSGFYVTSSNEHAMRWATLVTRRRKEGQPLVSVFILDEDKFKQLRVLVFAEQTEEWLSFVGANRRGVEPNVYDVVVGPVANDDTMPTLRLYFAGAYTEKEAIERLLPQKLQDQYAFKTQVALDALEFCEVVSA